MKCLAFLQSWLFRILFIVSLLALTACDSFSYVSSPPISRQEEALTIAQYDLPTQGRLEQRPDGFVYLKVSNQYVHRLFPLVKEPGFFVPQSIQRHTKVGAHISVFYKGETRSIEPIQELGKIYSFEPTQIRIVRTTGKEFIILEVKAPQLEHLRQRYGLSPKLMGHEFHITLAERNTKRFSKIRKH